MWDPAARGGKLDPDTNKPSCYTALQNILNMKVRDRTEIQTFDSVAESFLSLAVLMLPDLLVVNQALQAVVRRACKSDQDQSCQCKYQV